MSYLRGIHGYKTYGPTKKLANKHGVHRMYAWNDLGTPTITHLTATQQLDENLPHPREAFLGFVCHPTCVVLPPANR